MKHAVCYTRTLLSLLLLLMIGGALSKPLRKNPPTPPVKEEGSEHLSQDTGLAYDAYLRQVVEVLESDEDFRKKLETSNVTDIKSGKIAMYLEMVNHTVRTRLDEIKRREISRLQELVRAQARARAGDPDAVKRSLHHLDLQNPHSFEIKDLETLIKKTTTDLEDLDKQRKEEFKEYEMEKKFEEEEKLKQLSQEERKKEHDRLQELKKKHAEHPKLNHPGSKDQLEEVWDKVDHLEGQDFDPRTFFFQHDINGDMEWSIDEVDAVLQLELDKVYDEKNSPEEDDPYERQEEMNRMREHVFKEMDKDGDHRITLEEFINYTGQDGNSEHFKEDEGWKTVDEDEDVFSEDDYNKFLEEHHAQPGVIEPPADDLHFQPEHEQGQQQQQFQQGQQQQFQQGQQQQQFQQPPQGQQFQQPPQGQHQQQQFQQPPQQQQQFQQQQPPQGQQQQQQQPPQGQQQQQQQPPQPPQGQQQQQQQQGNMNQLSADEQMKLQQQLKEMKEKLEAQQKNQNQAIHAP